MFASKEWTLDLTRKVVREAKKDRPVYFDDYSENETIIGQWLDGKPIYQLTITGLNFGEIKATAGLKYTNNLFGNNPHVFIITSFNTILLKHIISSHINGKNLDETYVSLGVNVFCSHKLTENFIYIYSGVPFSKGTELTLQYTKVSDAPNSFNPSMIKANKIDYQVDNLNVGFQDYSESEIIVGRWVDGKPLYRKSYKVTSPSTLNSSTVLFTYSSDIEIQDIDGFILAPDEDIPINFYYSAHNFVSCWSDHKNKQIKILVSNSSYISRPTIITALYTKTTDAPNSFSMDALLQQYNFNSNIENIVLDEYCSPDDVEEVLG